MRLALGFLKINAPLMGLGMVKHLCSAMPQNHLVGHILADALTMVALLMLMANVRKHNIGGKARPLPRLGLIWYTVMASIIKGGTHYFCQGMLASSPGPAIKFGDMARCVCMSDFARLCWAILPWVLKSFMFEIVFDGVHYVFHRLSHNSRLLYRFHKTHHRYSAPTVWTTYYMHPIDLIMSYSVPFAVALCFVPFTRLELALTTVYLSYIEMAGHAGKRMFPTSSFAQCVWLPRAFNIQLYTEDHDLHHQLSNCNYSKRFTLWDRLLGTYIKSPALFSHPQHAHTKDTSSDETKR